MSLTLSTHLALKVRCECKQWDHVMDGNEQLICIIFGINSARLQTQASEAFTADDCPAVNRVGK